MFTITASISGQVGTCHAETMFQAKDRVAGWLADGYKIENLSIVGGNQSLTVPGKLSRTTLDTTPVKVA